MLDTVRSWTTSPGVGKENLLAEEKVDESSTLEDDKFSLAGAVPRITLTARACGFGLRVDVFLPLDFDSSERNLRQRANLNSCTERERCKPVMKVWTISEEAEYSRVVTCSKNITESNSAVRLIWISCRA